MSNKPELRIGDEFLVDGKAFIVDGWEVHRAINEATKAQIDMQHRMVLDAQEAVRRGIVG